MQQVSTTDERERVQRIAQSFLALDLTSERLGEIRYFSHIFFFQGVSHHFLSSARMKRSVC
jgi:hypothetical protein